MTCFVTQNQRFRISVARVLGRAGDCNECAIRRLLFHHLVELRPCCRVYLNNPAFELRPTRLKTSPELEVGSWVMCKPDDKQGSCTHD